MFFPSCEFKYVIYVKQQVQYCMLQDISNKPGKFKIALKHFLQTHSFDSLDEFFDKQWDFSCVYIIALYN
jgi:hypothetical protein